ncbi:DUF547 domain-containing protein [Maribacter sp. ACAM166]|uniref:DUF547 domain-containing protein n=1 Tax=Maribacter sp. ACAM166 TaxID=2508996 RepID=UPI0010FF26E6|nr:DUF547 domain-containing protein [Maribacter sp. ACAM166]TLP82738.1 DUF547 domain-containing protein [Maribacter sp. ACAM166]
MKYKIVVLVFFLGISIAKAQQMDAYFNATDAFLKTHVSNGKVDYKVIVEQPAQLNALVDMAKNINVMEGKPNEYQAFWINTYNLLVIKGIVDNYPLKSPLDVDGFFDKKQYNVGDKTTTLNGIENELLRFKFPNEPRFHFVLVCAGLGCPPIIDEVYAPELLETQLQRQTAKALNDSNFIRVEGNTANVSKIFEWYKSDFENAGGIIAFINKFRTSRLPAAIQLGYYPYDWTLNSK